MGCYIIVLLGCPYTLARIYCIVRPSVSAVLCVHSCLFSPLSVHIAVWNRGHPGAAVMELPLVVDFTMNLKKDLKHRPFTESHET